MNNNLLVPNLGLKISFDIYYSFKFQVQNVLGIDIMGLDKQHDYFNTLQQTWMKKF